MRDYAWTLPPRRTEWSAFRLHFAWHFPRLGDHKRNGSAIVRSATSHHSGQRWQRLF
jgi:hypothetical protein